VAYKEVEELGDRLSEIMPFDPNPDS
jgi:hypothetical protein